jgi:hypothetical protein
VTASAALYWLLTAIAGGLVAGAVRASLTVEERIALAVVAGVLGGSLAALGFTTIAGIRTVTVLAGPVLIAVLALIGQRLGGDPREGWRQSLAAVPERWRTRELMWISAVAVAAVIGFSVLFAHTLFTQDGSVDSNFATVWADWSMHATTASNFALGHDLPPTSPVFSGTPLLYPFLPDFQSGMLLTLGTGIAAALAVPSALFCVAIVLLVVSLGRRLAGSVAVGVLAVAMCMLGGGLGIEGLYWDACNPHGHAAAQCAPSRFVTDPAGAVSTAAHTVANIPGTIAAQPRAYDALQAGPAAPLDNVQWYTPMLAWWLPQRPFLFGFAAVLCVLLLIVATRGDPRPQWGAFVVAGLLFGLLPLVHVHSFIALLLVLPVMALMWRRTEWLALVALAVVLATPRLVQIAHGDHGAVALGNNFPWLEPGWMSQAVSFTPPHQGIGLASVAGAVGGGLRALVTPEWWGFWFVNCGIVLPVMGLLGAATLSRLAPPESRPHRAARRVTGVVPDDLLRFCLPFLAIFAICNVVVFQSWEWDNTKLFAYWYFGGALLVAALVVHWWRSGWWRATLGTLAFVSVIMTGTVVMLRFLPWTPAQGASGGAYPWQSVGPYVWESADDRSLAAQVEQRTAPDAVILTLGRHNDPLMTLAGRRTVVGYTGWLWSYGIDYRARQADVGTMYQGCPTGQTQCAATELMHLYGVSYVEIPASQYLSQYQQGNLQWWSSTFAAVARAGDVTVYDVRSAR